jgi:hypothetical protein
MQLALRIILRELEIGVDDSFPVLNAESYTAVDLYLNRCR